MTPTQGANLAVLILVTVMAVLLNSSVLEEQTNRDIDFDTELKVAGVANALAGIVGGLTGFSTVPKTMMCYKMHGSYHSGIFTTLYFVFFLVIFIDVVQYVPLPVSRTFEHRCETHGPTVWYPTGQRQQCHWKASPRFVCCAVYFIAQVLGGFVVAIGLELMVEWIWMVRKEVGSSEFVEILALFTIFSFSFVGGFVFGIFSALAVFAARYSNVPIIKTALTMAEYQG